MALAVVAILGAFGATSAFALNKFLWNGGEITKETPVTLSAEFLLEDMGAAGAPDVLCSLIWIGSIKVGGKTGLVTEALMLKMGKTEKTRWTAKGRKPAQARKTDCPSWNCRGCS
ncbi:MAG TPA: hypothetical protein VFW38_08500 [Solirubrobacteraceae bacterium]|nr:hypothetical protein [Solirubrobacteraceae bacterium]